MNLNLVSKLRAFDVDIQNKQKAIKKNPLYRKNNK